MKGRKRRGKPRRTRRWDSDVDNAFSHDRSRHIKAEASVPVSAGVPSIPAEEVEPNAIVVAHSGQWAFVYMDGEEKCCLIHPALLEEESTLVVPGDNVLVEMYDEEPMVRGVAPRTSKLSRVAHVHSRLEEQIIAANVDLLVIVASAASPRFKAGLIDRYLVAAQVGGVAPLLVVNKMDLVDTSPVQRERYHDLDMAIIETSCIAEKGIEELRQHLGGKLSVFAGQSGVGKSSLLNALDPTLDLDTQEVSTARGRGRHTTTRAHLHTIGDDIRIIDTPGIRTFSLTGVSAEELSFYFPEFADAARECRFRNCTHVHEPDCAVRAAVEAGDILRGRYDSYVRILKEL